MHGPSPFVASRGYSSLWCTGFSLQWLLLLWSTGARHGGASTAVARGLSSCGSQALESRLSSCGAWALLLCGMWDLPGPGLEPVSPALAGGFSTTAPPGESQIKLSCSTIFFLVFQFIMGNQLPQYPVHSPCLPILFSLTHNNIVY